MSNNLINEVWFRSINKNRILKELNYNETILSLIKEYIENGFIIIDNNLHDSIFDNIINSNKIEYLGNENQPLRALHAWRYNTDVRQIAIQENIIQIIEILYQRKAIPFLTTNFKYGSQVQPHTDAIKYQTFPEGFMCAVWTPLEDVDEYNGPIELFPKSHLLKPIYIDNLNIIAKNASNRYAIIKIMKNTWLNVLNLTI